MNDPLKETRQHVHHAIGHIQKCVNDINRAEQVFKQHYLDQHKLTSQLFFDAFTKEQKKR